MKFFSKMKKQTAALSLTLALGLCLSLSTSPVYGNPTGSTGLQAPGGNQQALVGFLTQIAKTRVVQLVVVEAATWMFGLTSSSTPASYPSNALDR
jgi:hypothetical protein